MTKKARTTNKGWRCFRTKGIIAAAHAIANETGYIEAINITVEAQKLYDRIMKND